MKKVLITLGLTALMAVSSPVLACPMGPGGGMGPRMGFQRPNCYYRPVGGNISFSTGGYYRPYYNNCEVSYPSCGYYTVCPTRFYEPGVAVNLRIPIMF